METFNNFFENPAWVHEFEILYEDISEPLKEYWVNGDGSLTLLNEPTLLGVRRNGKWGWVSTKKEFVIPPEYDSGWVLCYNGIIIMQKNGYFGGLYRSTLATAFGFKYSYLSCFYNQTFLAHDKNNMQALVKPGEIFLTRFKYLGFLEFKERKDIATYERLDFWGRKKTGIIHVETGSELS